MSLHKEIHFEVEIAEYLGQHGWLYEDGVSVQYDRTRALFPEDVIAWVQESQPEAWQALAKGHGLAADTRLLDQLRQNLDTRGTLDVLRNGIELFPVKSKIALAQFRPASGINAAIMMRYAANRLRVVRQVRYSEGNENCIDLVFFLNGLPVATVELKSDFTQSVKDAVDQYRFDRHPQPKGQKAEPLLSFPGGALVHFAVSNSEAQMATRLAGPATKFLPFNQGDHGAAGNPPSPSGHRTSYLWEEVWERESFLDILGRYLVTEKDDKKKLKRYIFPRYQQLDATRKLLRAVKAEAAGGKYLIQHSAGSGKTNSIAWAAHFFADLHDAENKKVFDTVIVVSDRNVIDQQLQDAIFDFERTKGVVTSIKGMGGSKSKELAEALSGEKKIVVCTIQTFPALHEKMTDLVQHQSKRFAVIADEAHSSQTGDAAIKLKQVLSAEEWKEVEDGGEVGFDDVLRAQMTARTAETAITYVAFTATPKAKTLELFGRRPQPDQPAGPTNLPEAFHVYSMRQAIEEGFILDVLRNYTSYKLAFRLAHNGKEYDDTEVERSEALKGIMRWVRLHPYNISQKVQVVVEHYLENVQPLLSGHAKAMVVVGSRQEAVRWQLAMQKYIQSQGYKLSALVAFSGEVIDKESGEAPFKETSSILNPNLRGRDIREAFKTDEYQILLVANKFQTGFDQPLLCGMYVDKRLGGIQAVQTLSRLNRAYSGPHGEKDTTYVLDFVNDPADVLLAFKTYYETATLEDVTDPNLVYNLRAKLDAAGHYDEFEVDRVVAVELDPTSKQGDLVRALEPVADRLMRQFKAATQRRLAAKETGNDHAAEDAHAEIEVLNLFKRDMESFGHAYTFLSQIFDYGNTALEKRAIFYKQLIRLLEFGRDREGLDLSKVVLTHHTLRNRGAQGLQLVEGESPQLKPLTDAGSGSVQEKEKELLTEIIAKVNDLFGADTTEGDKLVYVNNVIKGKLMESETLRQQAANNSKEQFANSPDLNHELLNAIMDSSVAMSSLSKEALESEHVRSGLKEVLMGPAQLYEALRAMQTATGATEPAGT
jgi:type I restriction enzyme R subunit